MERRSLSSSGIAHKCKPQPLSPPRATLRNEAMEPTGLSLLPRRARPCAVGHAQGVISPLKNPAPCFESLSMSGPPHGILRCFPLTLRLSKGELLFQRAVIRLDEELLPTWHLVRS